MAKVLILESKWLGAGRAVSLGEIREDLSEDEGKLLRVMGAATSRPEAIARREQEIAAEKAAAKKKPAAKEDLVPA